MADATTDSPVVATPGLQLPLRGLIAFALLGIVGALGPDITPSRYWDLDHYLPRYILLAVSLGVALSAVRSRIRLNLFLGGSVLAVGGYLVAYIIYDCLRIIDR